MSLRRLDRRARLALLKARTRADDRSQHASGVRLLAGVLVLAGILILVQGCASGSKDFAYRVRSGDTVYAIGRRFDVSVEKLVRRNKIRDVHSLPIGTELWIPGTPSASRAVSTAPRNRHRATPVDAAALTAARERARREIRKEAQLEFRWPLRGRLTSSFGPRRGGLHEGIDISARRGTPIFAAESGKIIHSGRLGDYGKVVIVKHSGSYRSVYAHARKLHVRSGQFVERGQKVAEVGTTGNATGPHLHFEIRKRKAALDPALYLD